MKSKKNLTANEQLLLALEFLSLANEYVIQKKQLTSVALAEWLDELQDPERRVRILSGALRENFDFIQIN